MNDEVRKLEAEARLTEYELHQLVIDLSAMKIEFASGILQWLDQLEDKYPEAKDSLKPLGEKLCDVINHLEDDLEEHFDALLEVSDLCA